MLGKLLFIFHEKIVCNLHDKRMMVFGDLIDCNRSYVMELPFTAFFVQEKMGPEKGSFKELEKIDTESVVSFRKVFPEVYAENKFIRL